MKGIYIKACVGFLLAFLPFFFNDYALSILVLCFYFAFVGQAWNLMMGFAGQLSLGHALYVGVGGYVSAAFFVHFGVSPWVSMSFVFFLSAGLGAFIAWLGFRFAIKGVYFALLTIAFAESFRIIFDHLDFFGGASGLFIPVKSADEWSLWELRGRPVMFYYLFLLSMIALHFLIGRLLKSRFGYRMLALREDQEAAESLGINLLRVKMTVVALSGGITSLAGVFFAFHQNSLFPEQTFAMARSIEFIMGPIVGGVGTLWGPIVGALCLTPLGEGIAYVFENMGLSLPGLKHLFYGFSMLIAMLFMPKGFWPFFQKKLFSSSWKKEEKDSPL